MGWLIFLGILLLLGCLPLGIRVHYGEDGPRAALLLGRIAVTVYPFPGWLQKRMFGEKKPKKEKPAETPKVEQPKKEEAPDGGGSWKKFLPLVSLGLDALGALRRKLRVNHLVLKLTLAGDDPCDLAVNYGRAWAAVGNLLPRSEQAFVIRKREIEVQCDFQSEETRVLFGMDVTITLGRLLGLAVKYDFRAVKIFLKMKRVKAVQTNE